MAVTSAKLATVEASLARARAYSSGSAAKNSDGFSVTAPVLWGAGASGGSVDRADRGDRARLSGSASLETGCTRSRGGAGVGKPTTGPASGQIPKNGFPAPCAAVGNSRRKTDFFNISTPNNSTKSPPHGHASFPTARARTFGDVAKSPKVRAREVVRPDLFAVVEGKVGTVL